MPHQPDEEYAQLFVSPFGEQVWSQRGVRIAGPSGLKRHFLSMAEREQLMDELQDVETMPLRRRFLRG